MEARDVQLVALKLPPALPQGALLQHLVNNQAETVAAVARLVPAGAADVNTDVAKTPFAFVRVTQPTGTPTQAVRATAETTIDLAIPNPQLNAVFVDDLFTTVVKVLLIPFVFAFLGIAVVISAIQSFFYNAAVIEAGKTDDSRRVASMQTATGSQQTQADTATFTKHVTDRADADESSTVLTAASSSEPSHIRAGETCRAACHTSAREARFDRVAPAADRSVAQQR